SYDHFLSRPLPTWGGDLGTLKFEDMLYYASSTEKKSRSWDDVPTYIKETFDKLGIPEAERKFLGGVGAQYESEVVYHSLRDDLAKKGVIFLDTDTALREHLNFSSNISEQSSRQKTTSLRRLIVPCGVAAVSFTFLK